MNFKGHVVGGVVAGVAVICAAEQFEATHLWSGLQQSSLGAESFLMPLQLFGFTLFCSLFPDADISSYSQRIVYAGLLGMLVFCLWFGQTTLFVVLALLAPLPLLSKHRGWLHQVFTPWWLLPSLFALQAGLEFEQWNQPNWRGLHWASFFTDYGWLLVAGIVGYSTHLLLDSKWVRRLR